MLVIIFYHVYLILSNILLLQLFSVCDGFTPTTISTCNWAGDYAVVSVTAGETYTFDSVYFSDGSPTNDYLTISTDGNATAAAYGVAPLTWVSDFTGDIWLNFNTDAATCGTEDVCRISTVTCGVTCLNGNIWPAATFTPSTCDGLTPNDIVTDGYAGEYSNVTVFNLGEYTFRVQLLQIILQLLLLMHLQYMQQEQEVLLG